MPDQNPFRRGYDKLAIQLHIQSIPNHPELRELSYVIHAQEGQSSIILGIRPTLESAQQIVRRLSFETGHFSRCWEISAAHLPEDVFNRLFLTRSEPRRLQLEFFENTDQSIIGCKLLNTPWTDKHLCLINTSSAELRQQQLEYGLSAEFVEILHLAGQADVRFLLFDPDAAPLDGLPMFKEEA